MAVNKDNLNRVYALGKDKKAGKWMVGQWANQSLWTVDGSNEKICDFSSMTRWKYFSESLECASPVHDLKRGEKVRFDLENSRSLWYFVIDFLREEDGKYIYLVGT